MAVDERQATEGGDLMAHVPAKLFHNRALPTAFIAFVLASIAVTLGTILLPRLAATNLFLALFNLLPALPVSSSCWAWSPPTPFSC